MAKILVIGDIYFETQYFIENIPTAKQVSIASETTNNAGSKTINAARVMAGLKNDVSFIGRVGDDNLAEIVLKDLKDKGIDTSHIKKLPNFPTGTLAVQTNEEGNSSVTLFFGANKAFTEEDLVHFRAVVKDYDLVYAATNLPLDYLYQVVDICSKSNVLTFIDVPNQHKDIDLTKLKGATFIAPNREEAGLLLNTTIITTEDAHSVINQIAEKIKTNVIITLDKDGAVFIRKDEAAPVRIPAKQVDVVDSTAAGDIFRAVFVSEYLKSKNTESSLKVALETATESTRYKGVNNTIAKLSKYFS